MSPNLAPDATPGEVRHLLGVVHATAQGYASARDLYQDRLAPDFSPFEFIQPDELKLSRIIGWLLDPKGSHGQGPYFLRAMLGELGVSWPDWACRNAIVRLEVLTHRLARSARRIDILVTSDQYALGIENKPWAGDQASQLADYLAHLKAEYKEPTLLYLCGYADRASETSLTEVERALALSANQLVEWTYRSLAAWLEASEAGCKADRVRGFMREFAAYIHSEFEGAANVSETSHIVSQVVADDALLSPALDIIQAGDAIRSELIAELAGQLKTMCDDVGWTVICELDKPPYASASIFFPAAPDYPFTIEFQSSPFKRLIYGLKNYELCGTSDEAIQRSTTAAFGAAGRSKYWPWTRAARLDDQLLPLHDNWQAHKDPWMGVKDASTACTIIACASQFELALLDGATGLSVLR